jgi:NADPH:quinone reductase-like Zn-dependent oxidoreductase
MLAVARVKEGDTIVVHGASGAVGVSVLQQARLKGVKVIGTASEKHFDTVKKFGGTPVQYGPGLKERIQAAVAPAQAGIVAALDTVGTDEAIDVSLALLPDRQRIVSIAAFGRAQKDGFQVIGGGNPASAEFRNKVRAHLVELAAEGKLEVPIGKIFPFEEVKAALELLKSQHPGGKLALVVNN